MNIQQELKKALRGGIGSKGYNDKSVGSYVPPLLSDRRDAMSTPYKVTSHTPSNYLLFISIYS